MKTALAVRIRNVEWPMNVTATVPGSTRAGGGGCGASATDAGHAVRWRVRAHCATSRHDRPVTACGLKNRTPSQ
jgi:hypothetical protein